MASQPWQQCHNNKVEHDGDDDGDDVFLFVCLFVCLSAAFALQYQEDGEYGDSDEDEEKHCKFLLLGS